MFRLFRRVPSVSAILPHSLSQERSKEKIGLARWDGFSIDYPKDRCLHELVEEQAEHTPEAVAVVFESTQLTYRQLNERANQLAHHLQELGVGPDTLVGICLERSLEMVVGLLAILKAGGAYLPLDPGYPKERLAFMVNDSGAAVFLTQQGLRDQLQVENPNCQILCLDTEWGTIARSPTRDPISGVSPENLAYVIYTSGSTGLPRGVSVPHSAVVRLVCKTSYVSLGATDVFLQFAPLSFDAPRSKYGGACSAEGDWLCSRRASSLWTNWAGLFGKMA
jgi:non-ribosomal peptide synthetase component F